MRIFVNVTHQACGVKLYWIDSPRTGQHLMETVFGEEMAKDEGKKYEVVSESITDGVMTAVVHVSFEDVGIKFGKKMPGVALSLIQGRVKKTYRYVLTCDTKDSRPLCKEELPIVGTKYEGQVADSYDEGPHKYEDLEFPPDPNEKR